METYQEKMFKIAKNMVKWNKYEKNKSNLMLSYSDTILKTMFLIDNNIYQPKQKVQKNKNKHSRDQISVAGSLNYKWFCKNFQIAKSETKWNQFTSSQKLWIRTRTKNLLWLWVMSHDTLNKNI